MRDSLSPIQEKYKSLSQENKDLLHRFNITANDLSEESLLKFMIIVMKKIDRLEGLVNP